MYVVTPAASAPIDPTTGQPVDYCAERIEYLLQNLQKSKATIVIPTPTLAEILVRAPTAGPAWLSMIERSKYFRIADFDKRAAVEHAAFWVNRTQTGTKHGASTRAQAKFDDQIVAIATVAGATVLYSDDPHIGKIASSRFQVQGIGDLPLPPSSAQASLPLSSPPQNTP